MLGDSRRTPLLPSIGGKVPMPPTVELDLSIVATMYRSSSYLDEFYNRSMKAATQVANSIELILVNDGCPSDSLIKALELQQHDSRVRVIDLARNYGHHKAMMTGLSFARGHKIFLIDCDLEEDPNLLVHFWNVMQSGHHSVVFGVQATRSGSIFRRWSGQMFYTAFNKLSKIKIPENVCTIRLMCNQYVRALMLHDEREANIAGLWALTGFDQRAVEIDKKHKGQTTYGFRRQIAALVEAITAFSQTPLKLVFLVGGFISAVSALAIGYVVARSLFFGELLAGWPSLIASIWLLGGLNLFAVGVIGIYLGRVFSEVKKRPYSIIKRIYER